VTLIRAPKALQPHATTSSRGATACRPRNQTRQQRHEEHSPPHHGIPPINSPCGKHLSSYSAPNPSSLVHFVFHHSSSKLSTPSATILHLTAFPSLTDNLQHVLLLYPRLPVIPAPRIVGFLDLLGHRNPFNRPRDPHLGALDPAHRSLKPMEPAKRVLAVSPS